MLICFLIFVLSFAGSTFGDLTDEIPETCLDLLPYEEINEANWVPEEEQLKAICVGVISYMECEEQNMIQTSNRVDDEGHIDEDFHQLQQFFLDLCSEDSKLQKDYLASRTCFENLENEWNECFETAQDTYLSYRMFVSGVQDEDDLSTISYDEPYCMMNSYATVCLGIKILEICGEESHATFEELLRRSGYLKQYCSKAESDTLKSQFLGFLNLEQSQLELFRNIFDFKKK